MSPSQVPRPVHVLSPDLVGVLEDRVGATMLAVIKKNKHTHCFSESPAFAAFHSAICNFGREDNPFVAKILSETCQEDDVRDMFSPGLPYHIAVASSTSSPKPKFFCQYLHEGSMRYGGGNGGEIFWTFSLHYHQLVKIQNRNGDIIRTIPAAMGSSEMVRLRNGLKVENDHLNIMLAAGEWATSPVAVGFIRDKVETIFMVFTMSAVDMIRYMEEEWETLVAFIETVISLPVGNCSWTPSGQVCKLFVANDHSGL
ncbi:hypothetical protein BKA82DRAFT_28194 [Pisolithus tinctorius]|nr:hypothetical protein BKA82DRAFT_28194 [Pisolithus tinctorius]